MKKAALVMSLVFLAGLAVAEEKKAEPKAEPKAETKTDAAPAAKAKTHEVTAEVVSADPAKNTLTIKGEKGDMTVPVDAKAAAGLKDVKAGDKLMLTCEDDEKGAHKGVIAMKKAEAPAAPATK